MGAGYDYSHSNSGASSDTLSVDGSVGFEQNFYVYGSAGHTDRDHFTAENHWNFGGGFHAPITERADFVGEISTGQESIDGRSRGLEAYTAEVGLRSALATHLEGFIYTGYTTNHNSNVDRTNDSVSAEIGGQYRFNHHWGLVGDITLAPSSRYSHANQQYYIGPRFSF